MSTVALRNHRASSAELHDIEGHIKALRRYAFALVGNAADADDLVQETLLRALTYVGRGKAIRNLRSYLLAMLHNVRIDGIRARVRAGEPVGIDGVVELPLAPSQDEHLMYLDVVEAIQNLSEEQRKVLLLVGLEGMNYQEAANVLGVPIGTVMSRLNRGRIQLRRALGYEALDREPASMTCGGARVLAELGIAHVSHLSFV